MQKKLGFERLKMQTNNWEVLNVAIYHLSTFLAREKGELTSKLIYLRILKISTQFFSSLPMPIWKKISKSREKGIEIEAMVFKEIVENPDFFQELYLFIREIEKQSIVIFEIKKIDTFKSPAIKDLDELLSDLNLDKLSPRDKTKFFKAIEQLKKNLIKIPQLQIKINKISLLQIVLILWTLSIGYDRNKTQM